MGVTPSFIVKVLSQLGQVAELLEHEAGNGVLQAASGD
jgi:hypothetical protein